ncbi:MAG TPA: type II toxin-antitoxin system VapC family toxin [Rhodospirillaceae bacterium]|nr:type II toxin-antitoxin system VapC family toxin [Rhodospirillaceae bacterium]
MRLLLDTHVLLWTLAGSARIAPAREMILSVDTQVFASIASWWEISIKAAIGKLDADVAALRLSAQDSGFLELPILGAHVEALAGLPLLHRDPFDRMLIAQAVAEPMCLLTADAQLVAYSPLVKIIA